MPVARIGVSLEGPLLKAFDRLVREGGYRSRSEALRNLIRTSLARPPVRSSQDLLRLADRRRPAVDGGSRLLAPPAVSQRPRVDRRKSDLVDELRHCRLRAGIVARDEDDESLLPYRAGAARQGVPA